MNEEGYEPPYQTIGSGYEIFETIKKSNPVLMLWLGNTAHLRQSDWSSKSGYIKRYTTARAQKNLQNLLANIPHYATWGSADYGSSKC